MPRKVFTAGEILTAADVNTNLMDQAVMVFDDDAARTTAIPTPVEGMVTYLKDDDEVTVFDGSAFKAVGPGKILQVVFAQRTATFSISSTAFTDFTDVGATITPSTTDSKIIVLANAPNYRTNNGAQNVFGQLRVTRNGTQVYVDARHRETDQDYEGSLSLSFVDTPATTSATTYQAQIAATSTGTFSGGSITLMEVAG